MNKKQYNNIIKHTLENEIKNSDSDNLENIRKIFKNMGVALPVGNLKEVNEALKSEDFMGWRSCTAEEAKAAANNGTAAIGISDTKISLLAADEENSFLNNETILSVNENFSNILGNNIGYFTYSLMTTFSSNIDYRGRQILSNSMLQLLNYNKKFYISAANSYGIPWKLLAAIHYREYKLKREGPGNGNGPYQIWGSTYPTGTLSDSQFQKATNDAAAFIKGKASGLDLSISNNIKSVLFAYNGKSSLYKTQALNLGFSQAQANIGEGSPYVMNIADLKRDPTVEPTKSNSTWGQIKTDGSTLSYPANNDYGAFVIYSSI